MATKAAKEALVRARVRAEDLDAIIVATTSPDYFLPTAACLVQENLGARKAAVARSVSTATTGSVRPGGTNISSTIWYGWRAAMPADSDPCMIRSTAWSSAGGGR